MMKRSELKTLFADMKERLKNVSSDPDEQRLDYQVLANYAVATINRVVNTGLREDAEREATNSTKQKNCSYCHDEKPLLGINHDEIRVYVAEKDLLLIYDFEQEAATDEEFINAPFGATRKQINYCPMCGRPLNEENE